ncbi:MAG TPA: molybdopterin converting factor subunit 1 [Candidatus Acidoferrales bacterium]|nr:molybdopterin converting factor subunit 1 [Candidatus Acidoferrales bacterium]
MTIRLRFFASLRERLGRSEAELSLPAGATVDALWSVLCAAYPQLAELRGAISFAVNHEYVDRDHRLSDNDEVALIPPVSGGMDVRDRLPSD